MDALPALWGRITAENLVQLTGCHASTARRWKRLLRVPAWLERLVQLFIDGHLGELHGAWRGWHLVRGELITPEGRGLTPGQLYALPYLREQVRALELELQRLRAAMTQPPRLSLSASSGDRSPVPHEFGSSAEGGVLLLAVCRRLSAR
jgi:hypothetical protein